MTIFKGRCSCGHVHYQLLSKPMFVHCCHCTYCQRETGSAFAIDAVIENDRVELLQGEVIVVDTATNSGKPHRITRCPHCHIALWSYINNKSMIFVRAGTLDEPNAFPPDIHIYTSTKQPWITLSEDVPVKQAYYHRSKEWPIESQERATALRKKPKSKT